eukprot:UN05981
MIVYLCRCIYSMRNRSLCEHQKYSYNFLLHHL